MDLDVLEAELGPDVRSRIEVIGDREVRPPVLVGPATAESLRVLLTEGVAVGMAQAAYLYFPLLVRLETIAAKLWQTGRTPDGWIERYHRTLYWAAMADLAGMAAAVRLLGERRLAVVLDVDANAIHLAPIDAEGQIVSGGVDGLGVIPSGQRTRDQLATPWGRMAWQFGVALGTVPFAGVVEAPLQAAAAGVSASAAAEGIAAVPAVVRGAAAAAPEVTVPAVRVAGETARAWLSTIFGGIGQAAKWAAAAVVGVVAVKTVPDVIDSNRAATRNAADALTRSGEDMVRLGLETGDPSMVQAGRTMMLESLGTLTSSDKYLWAAGGLALGFFMARR